MENKAGRETEYPYNIFYKWLDQDSVYYGSIVDARRDILDLFMKVLFKLEKRKQGRKSNGK